jgi:hypothetical protein
MSNHHVEDGVLLRAIDRELPPRRTSQVKRHIERCASCQERFDRLRRITARIAGHRRDALEAGPAPDQVERQRFLARLDQEPAGRARRIGWLPWVAQIAPRRLASLTACAALSLVVLAGLLLWTRHPRPVAIRAVRSRPAEAMPVAQKESAPKPNVARIKPARAIRPAHRMVKTRKPEEPMPAQAASAEITTPFFALPFSDASLPLDQDAVIRVELPRSALELAGLPVDEDRRNERVDADLVVGADGLARAIRFVRLVR